MRDGVALVVLAVAAVAATAWFGMMATDLRADRVPNASFDVNHFENGTVVVEHAGGEPLDADSVRLLVYEDRRVLPDRTVHGSHWDETGTVRPGDRRRLEDRRIEAGHRLVVRWFGVDGQAKLAEVRL